MRIKFEQALREIQKIDSNIKLVQHRVEQKLKPHIAASTLFLGETTGKVAKTQAALAIFDKKIDSAKQELNRLLQLLEASLAQKNKEHAITSLM